ncbi:MAG: hypothetical protein WC319_11565 [Candidatus Paceibacterota bacterium]|jgi:hypothetical protein
MAYTAKRTTQGFEYIGNLLHQEDAGMDFELTPNTAFTKGDMVVLTNGKVAAAAANAANVLGVMAETFSTTTNPSAKTTKGKVLINPFNIYRCSFADHKDGTATGGTTTTLIDTALGTSDDDRWNGALLFIYEGKAAGSIRTVTDYDGSDETLTVEEPFPEAPDATSKYILLGLAGEANDVINVGKSGVNLKDANTIDANAAVLSSAVEQGPLVVLRVDPVNLTMDVIIKKHLFNS